MNPKYTHFKLNEDVAIGIGGYYTPEHESRLKYHGRDVLYVSGRAIIESSCCGSGDWYYAVVPGYIVNWQSEKNEEGRPVTEIEPIRDTRDRDEIRRHIAEAEETDLIDFW